MSTKHRAANKPLVEMSRAELDRCFADASFNLHREMMQSAREHQDQDTVYAVTVLTTTDGQIHIAASDMEYGDGQGICLVDNFIGSVERSSLLLPGETLRREVRKVTTWSLRMLQ